MLQNIKGQVQGLMKYRNLLKKLVIRDIKVRYRKSFLGLAWTVLNPLLMMMILNMVFSRIFRMNIDNFPVYLLIGNIVFNFNSEATQLGLVSILNNASLIKKVYIPKYLFPFSKVLSCMVNLGFSFVALLLVMIATGAKFHITIITIWIPLLYILMFTLGLSLILSSVNVYFRDIGHLYGVFLTAWMYLTPLFYSIDFVPEYVQGIIKLNPLYHFVTFMRKVIMTGVFPGISENIICFGFGFGMLCIGLFVFKRLQDRFILYI